MELQTNPVFEEDMQRLCALPVMEELRGRTVLVTGATGLIGQTLVSALLRYGDDDPGRQIRVIACDGSARDADPAGLASLIRTLQEGESHA